VDTVEGLTHEQLSALATLGLSAEQMQAFLGGLQVVYAFGTPRGQAIAILQRVSNRLRSGIVVINDPGAGIKALGSWRGLSYVVAVQFGLRELELFGAEVINQRLAAMLARRRFETKVAPCPDELGDEEMTILTRVFPVL
jgi:hypothetical protein